MTVSISGAIDFLQDKYALSPALQGLVISSIMIGAGFSGFLSDKYGRRTAVGYDIHGGQRAQLDLQHAHGHDPALHIPRNPIHLKRTPSHMPDF